MANTCPICGCLTHLCGCSRRSIQVNNADLRAQLAAAQRERDAAVREAERLRNVRITIDTPNEVCDGYVTGTIAEIEQRYGPEALGWTEDWGEMVTREAREAAELRAVVGRLPKTADGKVVEDGMYLWRPCANGTIPLVGYMTAGMPSDRPTRAYSWDRCYSTEEAAAAARRAAEGVEDAG